MTERQEQAALVSKRAFLVMESYAGRSRTLVDVIWTGPKRARIRAVTRMRLAGRDRWLDEGETALVPKAALRYPSSW